MLAHSLSAYNFGVWHFKTRKNIEIVGSLARPMWFWGFDTLNREKYGIPEKLEMVIYETIIQKTVAHCNLDSGSLTRSTSFTSFFGVNHI